jgi:hypothetical protein
MLDILVRTHRGCAAMYFLFAGLPFILRDGEYNLGGQRAEMDNNTARSGSTWRKNFYERL